MRITTENNNFCSTAFMEVIERYTCFACGKTTENIHELSPGLCLYPTTGPMEEKWKEVDGRWICPEHTVRVDLFIDDIKYDLNEIRRFGKI